MQSEAVDYVQNLYAPPDDPVFELVPQEFNYFAQKIYEDLGSPTLTSETIWPIYRRMVERLEQLNHSGTDSENDMLSLSRCIEQWEVQESLTAQAESDDNNDSLLYDLIAGQELPGGLDNIDHNGYYYMGGVNGGLGPGTS